MSRDRISSILIICLCVTGIFLSFFQNHTAKAPFEAEKNGKSLTSKIFKGKRVLVLNLQGAISEDADDSFIGRFTKSSRIKKQLVSALKDKDIKGVLLRVNSPGGTVGMSQEIYNAIVALKKDGRFIVASMGDVAASGGYYISSACDLIYANPGTLTGSIGVILANVNYSGLMNKLGLKNATVKAGKYKDIISSFRDMTDEERKILQDLIDDTYNQFIDDVYQGRKSDKYGDFRKNLKREDIEELAEGMIYTGKGAWEVGLVDELGGYEDAMKQLQTMIKKKEGNLNADDLPVAYSAGDTDEIREMLGVSMTDNGMSLGTISKITFKYISCVMLPESCTGAEFMSGTRVSNSNLNSLGGLNEVIITSPVLVIAPQFINTY